MTEEQKILFDWLETNNSGGHDFTKPPPREMLVAAFPDEDELSFEETE